MSCNAESCQYLKAGLVIVLSVERPGRVHGCGENYLSFIFFDGFVKRAICKAHKPWKGEAYVLYVEPLRGEVQHRRCTFYEPVKKAEDNPLVMENGFFKERFEVKPEKLRKVLKTLIKKEFPRSRKIRLYVLDKFVEDEGLNKKRKII